ncbi:MAG: pyridoxal-phosphate dependent enzyme [Candidatus Lokiarchaeota archaeon]|nr:pyridoxal-phosphate dependent enzyme [Candidatus Lokiarchaeota archaeon]MBD3341021.1 pyridoxal-phosphate dependent enzyme [Candidatus Lokiarchaeota archaeon]
MECKEPPLFQAFPKLKKRVPWISLLSDLPSIVDRLTEIEKELDLSGIEIYIKRDDLNHPVYGGNKLRKFEFIFGDAIEKEKKGIVTMGGVGTNHGIACAIIANDLGLNCDLFLFPQPLTWHVQRSLLLYDYFGAKLHLGKNDITTLFKFLFFGLFHPRTYLMLPGGSPLFGMGSSLGTVGFINAIYELKSQIADGSVPEPDAIFIASGSTGTAAGLAAGCKLAGLKTKVHIVAVYGSLVSNPKAVKKNANKALDYLRKQDKSIPRINIEEGDFEFIEGYLGSDYGIKTIKGQKAVDLVYEKEGKDKGFILETTYTGKAMAAMFDYLKENNSKKVLFWNTYNSRDLDKYLRKTGFNFEKLPKKFQKFYGKKQFQCWQIVNCPKDVRETCPAYLNHEYRFWRVAECKLSEDKKRKAKDILSKAIILEEA